MFFDLPADQRMPKSEQNLSLDILGDDAGIH